LSLTVEEGEVAGRGLRRGVGLGVVAFACVLVLAGGAGAVTRNYEDPLEGYVNALDITTVTVTDASAGNFTIYVDTPNWQDIHSGDDLSVFIDTDHNVSGDSGAEYQATIHGTGTGTFTCGLYHWTGSNWVEIRVLACDFHFGTAWQFPRSDIGNPPDFQFYVRSWYGSESDRAPNGGWWFFDPTPPDTTITGGPSGSTPSTDATFTFTSSEAGSSFQCSLDGGAFAACGNPAVYHNLSVAGHTFQVRAIDSSGNIDPSPAARSWSVVDGTPPTAKAKSGSCCDARGRANVTYTLGDNTGQAAASVSIGRPGRRPAVTCSFALDQARTYDATCKVPASARGWLRFCVQAMDAAGNRSAQSCKPLSFRRLSARVAYTFDRNFRLTKFVLTGLAGGQPSIRCFGCRLSSRRHPVGTRMPVGSRIEVRVVKPRVRGSVVQLINVGGAIQEPPARCLPPGLSRPVISCRRTH
jgi:hypothetical protein